MLACTRLLRAGSTGRLEADTDGRRQRASQKLIGDGLGKISRTQHVMPMEQEGGGEHNELKTILSAFIGSSHKLKVVLTGDR